MKKNIDTEEAMIRWDSFAESYAANHSDQGDAHKEVLLNPTLFSLMGTVEHKKVLDAGCGEGYFSRLLAKSDAIVTAVDYSQKMIELAKHRTPDEFSIKYYQGNCEDLHFLVDSRFDIIVSNMVMQDLENVEKAFREMYRLLVDGGTFVFSILHPCFVTPESGWVKDDYGNKLHWKVDQYFYEGVYEQRFGDEEKVLLFHRTLTTYINTLLTIGFRLEKIMEPKPTQAMLKKYPSFEEDFRCADFVVFKLKK
ncbi:class I SAM-dependent methyltransferase [Virgibacillus pantothenticus]|uniref:class I SAM-dependent methyltransferase n=1 Tax=Virgibacillus pantothenticus TaxID=1473 RepID=UPI001B186825|nr:class I SAM-dependent methyltransferase [Virgibacillus pantothenticus]MBU8568568.1 class I SAM-dependent methyltransferase [Virgibacillus pantothenticus]MBU8602604.1 class I SAM-dependent methyltransferase [Virgibacillus pantothenticus]MBU8636724.1 class I SAM-dependent methyltransferase [Virgibacillus pantothenticus]MBU8644403.1 class I SAM-dependent methyltransferase [Virgibacillus pantothenticus]MBU8648518.1 class I SAM-dependent methyltransferase [Virgibacillus pantothenticus]